jgi:hypothetical protein
MEEELKESVVSGLISVVIGVGITYGVWQVTTTPWDIVGVLVAVSLSSFFSGFGSRFGAGIDTEG